MSFVKVSVSFLNNIHKIVRKNRCWNIMTSLFFFFILRKFTGYAFNQRFANAEDKYQTSTPNTTTSLKCPTPSKK